ncbi:hypothetical protein ACA910_021684 [Epithemia clementina (nom. ined.)]
MGDNETNTQTMSQQALSRIQEYQRHRLDVSSMAMELAGKHDKADVPTYLWDQQVAYLLGIAMIEPVHLRAFDMLRQALLQQWRCNVLQSWAAWCDVVQPQIQQGSVELWKIIHE